MHSPTLKTTKSPLTVSRKGKKKKKNSLPKPTQSNQLCTKSIILSLSKKRKLYFQISQLIKQVEKIRQFFFSNKTTLQDYRETIKSW